MEQGYVSFLISSHMEKIVWGQDLIQPHQTNFQHTIVSSPALT